MSKDVPELSEIGLLERVVSGLKQRGWHVERDRGIGLHRVDIFAVASPGQTFAIELKVLSGTVHFATLSNVATLRSDLAASGEFMVQPVLLAVGAATPSLDALARRLGLVLIVAPRSGTEGSIAQLFVDRLIDLAQVAPPIDTAGAQQAERLTVGIVGGLDTEPEEIQQLARSLLQDLRRLNVDVIPRTAGPVGGGRLEAATIVLGAVGSIAPLVSVIHAWIRRHPDTSVTLERHGDRLTLASPHGHDDLVQAWVERHQQDLGGGH